MELIPQGMTPLQPGLLQFPNQSLVPSGPLVTQTATQQIDAKNLKYKISKFTLKYGPVKNTPHPGLPPIETLANTPVTLGESKDPQGGYVAPGAGKRDVPVVLSKFNQAETFSGDALQSIFYALVTEVNKKRHLRRVRRAGRRPDQPGHRRGPAQGGYRTDPPRLR